MPTADLFTGLHHVSLLVADLQRSSNFYIHVLGLEVDESRPEMAFPGMWLKIGAQQIHLLCFDKTASGTGAEHPGRDAHFALEVTAISKVEEIMKRAEVPYSMSKSGRRALFCRDPDDNGIEFVELVR
ncbi:MAG: VOC family protein [Pseudomonadota bacterium]|nr:VOC family protein [Pseudomonadota bacterium]